VNKPATIEAGFKAAGGWKRCPAKGCAPPDFCILIPSNLKGGQKANFEIPIKVNRETREVEVTDPEWQTYPLPENSLLEMPHILF
jgi:hypothetical protein